jgi:hypothetical protein
MAFSAYERSQKIFNRFKEEMFHVAETKKIYTFAEMNDAIGKAVADEREACARLLETSEYTLMERILLCEMAKTIRARGTI